MYAAYRGVDACTSANPCTVGESDCDSDADCLGNLKCHQRGDSQGGYQPTPGVLGEEILPYDYDVCYDPANGII